MSAQGSGAANRWTYEVVRDWFDVVPLDTRGKRDLRRARERASHNGRASEIHGKVIAELTVGFWRCLVESRYLTSLWVPSTHRSFPGGNVLTGTLAERPRAS